MSNFALQLQFMTMYSNFNIEHADNMLKSQYSVQQSSEKFDTFSDCNIK